MLAHSTHFQSPSCVKQLLFALCSLLAAPLTLLAQSVGIGTTIPNASAALDIVSSSKGVLLPRVSSTSTVSSPATGLVVFQTTAPAGYYYYDGTGWQQLATASGAAITASNGLTKVGADVQLGGTLTKNTVLDQAGQSLTFLAAGPAMLVTQAARTTSIAAGISPNYIGQSFTLTAPATIASITVYVDSDNSRGSASGTFTLWQGTPGGTALASQTVNYVASSAPTTITLSPAVIVAAGTYSFSLGTGSIFFQAANDVYSGGSAYSNTVAATSLDLRFLVQGPSITGLVSSGNGRVGVGTTTPRGAFDVDGGGDSYLVDDPASGSGQSVYLPGHLWLAPYSGTTGQAYIQARVPNQTASTSGGLTFRTTSGTSLIDALVLSPDGSAKFVGPVTATSFTPSDARLKQDVRPLTGALTAVQTLRGVRYHYRQDIAGHPLPQGEQVGVIAQEVEKLYPELVTTGADGYKAVNYAQLAPVLIEAIKELSAENETLKTQAATDKAQTTATLENLAQQLRVLEAGSGQAQR